MQTVLALDQGTTSSRAILFDGSGRVLQKAQVALPCFYPQPGWVEQDPMAILGSQFEAAARVLQSGVDSRGIAAIGITNQRETTIVWDRETGKPVCNAIVWQCRRSAPICEAMRADRLEEYIRGKTGLRLDAYFSATKLKWILDNISGVREKAAAGRLLFGTVDSWLIWNLTGGRAHVTDYSNASRTMLFDITALKWDSFLCGKLGIPIGMLPEALPSSGMFGRVACGIPGLEALEGVPICGVAGDQPSALFGQGCFSPGQIKNTYGTGCFALVNTGERRIRSEHGLVTSIAWGLDGRVEYALEGSVFNAGNVIQWLRDRLGLIRTAQECDELAESIPDTDGVYLVPAFTGLGAPYWDMYARGALMGLTAGTGRAQIARAVLESIAFQVTDLLGAIRADTKLELPDLRVDGGASVSNIMMQFQADLLGVPVDRPACVETTAWGAAGLAGLAAGIWHDREELAGVRVTDRVFVPQMDDIERKVRYKGWKRAVKRAMHWAK